jgi:hypothetical protein
MRRQVQVRMHHQGENAGRQAYKKMESVKPTLVEESQMQGSRTQE